MTNLLNVSYSFKYFRRKHHIFITLFSLCPTAVKLSADVTKWTVEPVNH